MPSSVIEITVNGSEEEFIAKPGTTLLSALRDTLGLTAAKRGCGVGTCGTCTCHVDGQAVMSCLVPVETINGAEVKTLEGTTPPEGLSPLQQSFLDNFATQCGFCTPGMIMAAEARLAEGDIDGAAEAALEAADPFDDAYASAWYRRRVLPVHVRRALTNAV